MHITIECCGATQRWCGSAHLQLQLGDGSTVGDALQHLAALHPEFAARQRSVACAVGDRVVKAGETLREGDRLALIPPVSGG